MRFSCLVRFAKWLPLEGKLAAKLTDEVSRRANPHFIQLSYCGVHKLLNSASNMDNVGFTPEKVKLQTLLSTVTPPHPSTSCPPSPQGEGMRFACLVWFANAFAFLEDFYFKYLF